jgi:hypothetical protein
MSTCVLAPTKLTKEQKEWLVKASGIETQASVIRRLIQDRIDAERDTDSAMKVQAN